MLTGTWSRAAFRPVEYIGEADPFAVAPLGWILHVVVGNGSPFGTFESAPKGSRKFSHLWIAKDGRVEQYQRFERESWAQSAGNPLYWSVETEGFPDEPLTEDQLNALAAWHVYSGAVDAVADRPGALGIGTHEMGGAAWGNHACPGHVRAAQRAEVIRRAVALRGSLPLPHPPTFPLRASEFYAIPGRSSHNGFTSIVDRANVRAWQSRMRARGWTISVDGLFGAQSDHVLRQFQHEKSLAVDGLLGPRSWAAAWTLPIT